MINIVIREGEAPAEPGYGTLLWLSRSLALPTDHSSNHIASGQSLKRKLRSSQGVALMVISLNSFAKPALVFLGAGMGGLLRYWLGGVIQHWWGPSFPLGTLIINVTGCLVMGFLATTLTGTASFRDEYRMILLIGL